jgi:hypothetical protein
MPPRRKNAGNTSIEVTARVTAWVAIRVESPDASLYNTAGLADTFSVDDFIETKGDLVDSQVRIISVSDPEGWTP